MNAECNANVFGLHFSLLPLKFSPFFLLKWHVKQKLKIKIDTLQDCALTAPGRLRRLKFGLGRLKKKSGRPSGRLDFGLCENPK